MDSIKFRYGLLTGSEKFAFGLAVKLIRFEGQANITEAQKDLLAPFKEDLDEFLKAHP
jgi:hypothetical protein